MAIQLGSRFCVSKSSPTPEDVEEGIQVKVLGGGVSQCYLLGNAMETEILMTIIISMYA